MKFKDAIRQGLDKKAKDREKADIREQASARVKAGKPESRADISSREEDIRRKRARCDKPTIGKPPHCGDPTCYDHEGWS